jgi:hypothetical protein
MPSFFIDGDKRRIYEVPGDELGVDFTYTTDPQGFRIYVPIGQGPALITHDVQSALWSRFQDYFAANHWVTLAFTRSGGASRGFDAQGNEAFQTNDFTLQTDIGWRIVLANYDHESIFQGNLFSASQAISLLDYSRVDAIPPPRSQVRGSDSLITYAIASGEGGNFTASDRATLASANSQATAAATNTSTLLSRLTTARAAALDLLQGISDRVLNIFKGLGRFPGVSVTQQDPTDSVPGRLETSDNAIRQTITKNPDGSVTVENES